MLLENELTWATSSLLRFAPQHRKEGEAANGPNLNSEANFQGTIVALQKLSS